MKAKVFKKKVGTDDTIVKLFNTMVGVEDADPILIEPKYENLLFYLNKIISVWDIFYNSSFCQNVLLPNTIFGKEILEFITQSKKLLAENTLQEEKNKIKTDFKESLIEELYELGSKYNKEALNKAYRNIKNSDLIKHINITLNNIKILLEEDKKQSGSVLSCLDMPNNLSNTFITKTTLDTKILSWSGIDFNFMYNNYSKQVQNFDKLVLFSLHITYINSISIYKVLMEPDIDIEKFVAAFSEKLDGVKNVIPGCDAAFKTLKKSLGLLKRNFGEYYKKFVTTSNNPGIILESFLADVSEKNKNNITVLVQFKKIIGYIKNNLPENLKSNETVNKLWNISEELFNNCSTNQQTHSN